ncbi:MAG: exodeoxyribonuclease VII large subunit [Oscillospiraceae bacterium]|nr:exodeoxyribonuclease VII large subunit [Oscillospiraceae bacterium]
MNREAVSVSALNKYVKVLLESDEVLSQIWVEGELSGVKLHGASGHIYMRVAEGKYSVKAVMFRSYASRLRFLPQDGMHVLLNCQVSLYEATGDFQLYVRDIIPMGEGARQNELEQARQRLAEDGIFADERKRPLPENPDKIAVITSSSGAVIRDIISTAQRRNPFVKLLLFPVNVQGAFAADAILNALNTICSHPRCADTVIIARGGGSRDDLWVFNDESLVRAAAKLPIPFVSAVGHETDFTLLDYAADVRAATPTAAAELAVPNAYAWTAHAALQLENMQQDITLLLQKNGRMLDDAAAAVADGAVRLVTARSEQLANASALLDSLSPLKTMLRGYAAISKDTQGIASAAQLAVGDSITVQFHDGSAICTVNEVNR